jgi:uncharacterized damage-inducible protein DinB
LQRRSRSGGGLLEQRAQSLAPPNLAAVSTKAELLRLWDKTTEKLNAILPTIPPHRFAEVDKAFGQWDNPGIMTILYCIDNENHHRGQGYVYLRALGIEPPHFWER